MGDAKTISVATLIRKLGYCVATICTLGEIMFFFSLPNMCGCIMCIFSWWTFSTFFLKRSIILRHPFGWLFYLSMVLYRFLPLIATFCEWKPVTYGFENPSITLWSEMLLFGLQSFAFFIVCYGNQSVFSSLNTLLLKVGFFTSYRERTIWCMAGIGFCSSLLSRGANYGDIGAKFIAPLADLRYIPLILFFPSLYKAKKSNPSKKILIAYFVFLELFSLTGNSREGLLIPLATVAILAFMNALVRDVHLNIHSLLRKAPLYLLILVAAVHLLQAISDSMLSNRGLRSELSSTELMKSQLSDIAYTESPARDNNFASYDEGWNEVYVDNFMLNRYCNMRISDETLHYAMQLDGWNTLGNAEMRDVFFVDIILQIPTNILRILSINYDKSNFAFSQGDYLYSLSTSSQIQVGYRVASHIGLGMACFGLLYFPIQFFLLLFCFYFLDTIVINRHMIVYSLAGLANVFMFLGRFRNANGCFTDAAYLVRGYWQFVLLNGIAFYVARTISKIFSLFVHRH